MNWVHVLHMLTAGFRLAGGHSPRALYGFYVHHHALGLLRSGVTSGSGGRAYLWWLAVHHVSPVDW